MVNEGLALWGPLLMGLGCMVLSIGVFCTVVRITTRKKRALQHATTPLKARNEEIRFQLVRQHAEQSVERISSAVNNELRILKKLREKDRITSQMKAPSYRVNRKAQRNLKKSNEAPLIRSDLIRDRYGEVRKLVDLGMSVEKISERVKIPQGEIMLVKKLKAGAGPSYGGTPARDGGLTRHT